MYIKLRQFYVWKNFEFAGEDRNGLEFLPLFGLKLITEGHEFVEEVVNDVRLENPHAEGVGHVLSVSLDLHVEGKNDGVPVRKKITEDNDKEMVQEKFIVCD